MLPPNLKDKFLHLLSKRGLLNDSNISKLVHDRTKALDFSECDVTDECLQKLSVCRNLRKIDLNATKDNRLTITSLGVEAVSRSCPHLQTIYLRRCTLLTDSAIIAIAQNCRHVLQLNVGGCQLITDASLIALGQNSRMLSSVNFSKTQVTDEGVLSLAMGVCKQSLKEVHMDHCCHLTDEAVEAIVGFCPRVSFLIFHGCPNITERSRQALEEFRGPNSQMKQLTWTVY
ncbi:protein AMN1 homolog isoform X2 [Anneissia japonica]|nr:protein AMN1 homolog isoform X2 [Anneissia japonica]